MQPAAARLRPPATLLALEDGEDVASGEAGAYRLAACTVHLSGALLLEPRDGDRLDEYLLPCASSAGAGDGMDWASRAAAGSSGGDPSAPMGWAGAALDQGGGLHSDDEDCGGGFAGDDCGAWGGGVEDAGPLPTGEDAGALRDAPRSTRCTQQQQQQKPEFFDPYAALDPNSPGGVAPRPFKRMARVARRPRARPQQRPLAAGLDSLLTLAPTPGAPLLLPEFGYALRALEEAERVARSTSSRGTSQRSVQTRLVGAFSLDAAAGGGAGGTLDPDDEGLGGGWGDDGYWGAGPDPDEGDDEGRFGPVAPEFALPELEGPAPGGGGELWAEDGAGSSSECCAGAARLMLTPGGADLACRKNATNATNHPPTHTHTTTNTPGYPPPADEEGISYEALCRAHIEAFLAAAAAAEVQSDLAARVSGWRAKITPVLEVGGVGGRGWGIRRPQRPTSLAYRRACNCARLRRRRTCARSSTSTSTASACWSAWAR